jgi:hypothetical protein
VSPTGDYPWRPDWVIAPGVILAEWMTENHISVPVLAVACAGRHKRNAAIRVIQGVLDRCRYYEVTADLLETGTGVPARFWLALEHDYRAGLAAGLTDASGDPDDAGLKPTARPPYVPLTGHTHRHPQGADPHHPRAGWLEHSHLGGGAPHQHDPDTGGQVPVPGASGDEG